MSEKGTGAVQIFPLDNPAYASESQEFLEMVREFEGRVNMASVRYESLHNHICTVVQTIYDSKRAGVSDDFITLKCHIALVDGILSGLSLFFLMPNRQPHIQTINWQYCFTKNPYFPAKGHIGVAYEFAKEVRKYKKKWGARYISFLATNPQLDRIAKRLFKKSKPQGTFWVAEDIRDSLGKIYNSERETKNAPLEESQTLQ